MKKDKFKKVLKQKISDASSKYLNLIRQTHSEVKDILYRKFEMQPYMKDTEFSIKERQLLFKLRTRMTSVKSNFSSMYTCLNCDLCEKDFSQSDSHLLDCEFMIQKCPELNESNVLEYEDVFKDSNSQLKIVKMFIKLFEIKRKHEEDQEEYNDILK